MTTTRRAAAIASALILLGAGPARAQDAIPTWPTLESIGLSGWSTSSGFLQLALSGRADVDVYAPSREAVWLIEETGPFVAPRVRLFTDLFVGASVFATTELRVDRGPAEAGDGLEARVEQAFVRWSPFDFLALQAGRFASAFGSYPTRHHGPGDWLIRPPLIYEYRTMVSSVETPLNSARFVAWKDRPEHFRPIGAPPVWAAPYQWGAMAFGVVRHFSWRAAWQNSAPSSEPAEWDWNDAATDRGNWIGAVGWRFAPWLRAEVSHSRGPYLARTVEGLIPLGADLADYDQIIWGGELLAEGGHTQVRLEGFHDTWQVPNVTEDPIDISWSLEARQELHPDLFVAARLGQIRFNEIDASGLGYHGEQVSGRDRWDYNVRRIQVGFGNRIATNAELRAEFMTNRTDGPIDPDDDLFSMQLWWMF